MQNASVRKFTRQDRDILERRLSDLPLHRQLEFAQKAMQTAEQEKRGPEAIFWDALAITAIELHRHNALQQEQNKWAAMPPVSDPGWTPDQRRGLLAFGLIAGGVTGAVYLIDAITVAGLWPYLGGGAVVLAIISGLARGAGSQPSRNTTTGGSATHIHYHQYNYQGSGEQRNETRKN